MTIPSLFSFSHAAAAARKHAADMLHMAALYERRARGTDDARRRAADLTRAANRRREADAMNRMADQLEGRDANKSIHP